MEPRVYLYSRFSSARQAAGDSARRQREGGEAFAAKVGLPVDRDLNLNDHGVSAFTGDHRRRGALGAFVALVDAGRIAPGSYLILDSIDRLSRETQTEFLHLLTGLTRRGVQVASVADDIILHADSQMVDFLRVQIQAERAQQESVEKGRKVKVAHAQSKARARDGVIWHSTGPFWLQFVDAERREDRQWSLIPERVAHVRRIFDMREGGVGTATIAVRLNEDDVPAPRGGHWHHSGVRKLLRNRAVLGEYQPTFAPAGSQATRRPNDGEPIPDYYPAIISEGQFHRVQALISEAAPAGRKANSMAVHNLFLGIGRCGVCGGSVGYQGTKNVPVLRCSDAARGLCSNRQRFRYPAVEAAILEHVVEFDLTRSDDAGDQGGAALSIATGRLAEVEAQLGRLLDMLEAGEADDLFRARYEARQAERVRLKEEVAALQLAAGIERHRVPLDTRKAQIAALTTDMRDLSGRDLYDLRARLAAALREVITEIEFSPARTVTAALGTEGRETVTTLPPSVSVSVLGGFSRYVFVMKPDRSIEPTWLAPGGEHLLESPRYRARFGLDDPQREAQARRALSRREAAPGAVADNA
ncbi:MAG: recombinase family protein [Phenylobacterium sp.]|jgi:DNA invertase Pin-like site-specific DNA recombinase|nr:recombinase family protein [Phenylobacterium sp.]